MDVQLIERYLSHTATREERRAVRAYLLEDIERCYPILERMRERAMEKLHMTEDPILYDLLARGHDPLAFSMSREELLAGMAELENSCSVTGMREVLSLLLEED